MIKRACAERVRMSSHLFFSNRKSSLRGSSCSFAHMLSNRRAISEYLPRQGGGGESCGTRLGNGAVERACGTRLWDEAVEARAYQSVSAEGTTMPWHQ